MRNILSAPLLTALFIAMTSTACTRKLSLQSAAGISTTAFSDTNKGAADPRYTNDITGTVLRSFYRTYGEIPDAKWTRSANGFAVNFTNKGINSIVYYKRNGVVDAEILYYFEDRLPQQVRQLVKSRFYDHAIIHITEIHKNGFTAFYVKVENTSTIKTIKVSDGEWEVVESLVKR